MLAADKMLGLSKGGNRLLMCTAELNCTEVEMGAGIK